MGVKLGTKLGMKMKVMMSMKIPLDDSVRGTGAG